LFDENDINSPHNKKIKIMGWWTVYIYGGDEPQSWKERIYEICEVNEYSDELDETGKNFKSNVIPAETLEKHLTKIEDEIKTSDKGENYRHLGYQVLGSIAMAAGFDINEDLKTRIIQACDADSYASENIRRRNVMKNYKNTLNEYTPENPINLEEYKMDEEPEMNEEELSKQFKEMFTLINARISKLNRGKEESSGNADYDEGFADASDEEIAFLKDFKELMEKQEQLGILLEQIASGVFDTPQVSSEDYDKKVSEPQNEVAAEGLTVNEEEAVIESEEVATESTGMASVSESSMGSDSSAHAGGDIIPG
jgi:hypothetical protein